MPLRLSFELFLPAIIAARLGEQMMVSVSEALDPLLDD
jgi:hypothetical protein